MRTYKPQAGEHIDAAARRAVNLAMRHKEPVQFTFNDKTFTVEPTTDAQTIIDQYNEGRKIDPDPIPETVEDALRQWDAGETVFTVEMGGLGPGYEMAIQGLAFE